MKSTHKLSFLLTTALLLTFAGTASATNGYFTHGTGTKNKGMAGAGIAGANDSIAIANNPAAAAFAVGKLNVGAALFSPLRSYESSVSIANGLGGAFTVGPNNIDSDSNYFVIPHVAYTWGLGEKSALGLAFYGRGGMNTNWKGGTATFDPDGPGPGLPITSPGTFGAGSTGVNLTQAFLDVAFASKASDHFAWGIALVAVTQGFKAWGIENFAGLTETFALSGGTVFPENLTGNGTEFSFGAGAKVGFDATLSDTVSVALMYQTKINMSEFDTYSDLFAQKGGFDIPANAKFGLTIRPRPGLSFSFDAEKIWYADIDSIANSINNVFSCPTITGVPGPTSGCLGGSNGGGFGWQDMTIYKVGVEWTSGSDWTWRAGFSTGSQPIPNTETIFNILAPAVIEQHYAFGFTKKRGQKGEFNLAFMYAPEGSVKGANPFDPTQTIELKMYQWELEAGYTWFFGK
jgi:long-chain fatty acid transport protein